MVWSHGHYTHLNVHHTHTYTDTDTHAHGHTRMHIHTHALFTQRQADIARQTYRHMYSLIHTHTYTHKCRKTQPHLHHVKTNSSPLQLHCYKVETVCLGKLWFEDISLWASLFQRCSELSYVVDTKMWYKVSSRRALLIYPSPLFKPPPPSRTG